MAITVASKLLSATAYAGQRTPTTPWQQCCAPSDPIKRGGYYRTAVVNYDRGPDVQSHLKAWLYGYPEPTTPFEDWVLLATHTTPDGLNATNAAGDGHNSVSAVFDENGCLLVAWQAHWDEYVWCYWEAATPDDIAIDSNTHAAGLPALISYPKFTSNADRTVNFWGRMRAAGDGEQGLWERQADKTWLTISDAMIEWTGAGGESPYMQHIAVNASGEHLVSWVWAQDNYTASYHGLKGFKCRKLSPGVWSFYDWTGATFSLPADDHARFTIWDVPINRGTPVHHGAALKDDGTPIVSLMNAGDAPNTSTNRYRFTRRDGAWVRQFVQEVHPTWNLIDANGAHDLPAAPNSEYQQASQVAIALVGEAEHWIYRTNYSGLDGNGIPQLQFITTLDDGEHWTAPEVLIELPAGDMQPTCDDAALLHHGLVLLYHALIDSADQYVGGGNSNAYLVYANFGNQTMGTLSSYARTALVDHFRNKAAYTPAATHHCAAFVGGTEVSGNSYARASATDNKTTWGDAASRAITNDVAFTFPDATGAWGTIDEIRIYDASSGGNELARHTLNTPVAISDSTGPLLIDAGEIDITFGAAGVTDTVAHELLDLMFGATANSPRATVYGTYFAGDPDSGGTETSAARVSITQATAWGVASAGLARTVTPIVLADEADATYWAEYTASSGGTRLTKALLPALPSGGVIPAGALRTSLT